MALVSNEDVADAGVMGTGLSIADGADEFGRVLLAEVSDGLETRSGDGGPDARIKLGI